MNSKDRANTKRAKPANTTAPKTSNSNDNNRDRQRQSGTTAAVGSTQSTTRTMTSSSRSSSKTITTNKKPHSATRKPHGRPHKSHHIIKELSGDSEEASNSSEMASTSLLGESKENLMTGNVVEQETNVDTEYRPNQDTDDDESSTLLETLPSPKIETNLSSHRDLHLVNRPDQGLPDGWEQHTDKIGPYFWHVATGLIQRTRPTADFIPRKESLVLYHDDEEINQASTVRKLSSDDDEYFESGAALTIAEDTLNDSSMTFVVYPLGSCEFDETQLVSTSNTKAIQRCILRLANRPSREESMCWGLDQSQPVLMRLYENLIQFTDIKTQTLLRSQPIPTIRTWAVDDDNNFAFVIEDRPHEDDQSGDLHQGDYYDSVDYALLNAPSLMCYVFTSMDDDDMSCRVAAKINEEINKYKAQMTNKISKSTRLQQMISPQVTNGDQTDADEDLDDLEESNEMTINVKFIGKVQVPRPTGVDTLNVAIDKCLADASKAQLSRIAASGSASDGSNPSEMNYDDGSPLIDAKLHVSPSSVIVENETTGEIIVECRIRYLTFIGISRRDLRWCGFIMQNTTNKSFVAHCFEVHPNASRVCDAIQTSCMKLYEKMVKNQQRQADATSIIPRGSKIRDTLAKTFSRIKLNPTF